MEPLDSSVSGGMMVDECSMEVPIIDDMRDSLEYKGNLVVLQAQVLLEDANYFRSVHHKLDSISLRIYRIYHSWPVQILLGIILAVIHLLVLIETPSSLSWNADLRIKNQRVELPCWFLLMLEIFCLLFLVMDCCCKTYMIGNKRALRNPWLMTYIATLFISIVDWAVSASLLCGVFRFRRFLRPLFLLQHSSIMKKTIKCLRNSLTEVVSVLLFLMILIYLFTLIGMCIFPTISPNVTIPTLNVTVPTSAVSFFESNSSRPGNFTPTLAPTSSEAISYFRSFWDSLFSLLVLVTTANNPDIMMPVYNQNRFYSIYFIGFVVIGLYCLTNMLTAIIYNQFRGYFLSSIQTQLFRRRVAFRAAYSILISNQEDLIVSLGADSPSYSFDDGLPVFVIRKMVPGIHIPMWKREQIMAELRKRSGCALNYSQFSEVMAIMDKTSQPRVLLQLPIRQGRISRFLQQLFCSRWFDHFGMLVCIANIVVITVEITLRYDIFSNNQDIELEYINAVFIAFYLFEQVSKVWANGMERYLYDRWNLFDLFLTIVLVITEIVQIVFVYSSWLHPDSEFIVGLSFWDGTRIVNLLIVIRFVRIVPRINSIRLVGSTIRDLTLNLKSFAGVLLTAYYVFGLLGMELFGGAIDYDKIKNVSLRQKCGTYAQLEYWSNNFDDFAAAIVTLWDLMVVNNWHVIVKAYTLAAGRWAHIYFVMWWLLSVLVIMNLVVALIIENFIQRWDKSSSMDLSQDEQFRSLSLYAMFKESLQEPLQEELLVELKKHPEITRRPTYSDC